MTPEKPLKTLVSAYENLRTAWHTHWPGLDAVLAGCLQWLAKPGSKPAASQAHFHARMLACARLAEDLGRQMQALGTEPAYHNRLHTADALVGCTLLLKLRRKCIGGTHAAGSDFESTCLLALLLHDLGHDGRINTRPFENESHSVALFRPWLADAGFEQPLIDTVAALVMLTEPRQAIDTHRRAHSVGPGEFECMALLVTEADILASALPFPGVALTEALSQEWSGHSPEAAHRLVTPHGRLGFLEHAANFSSPASQLLGVKAVVARQIANLRAAEDAA